MQNSKATEEFQNIAGLPKGRPGFFIRRLIMTLKKSKRDLAKGQAIFEYFILTTVVVAVVLFFTQSSFFKSVKNSCEGAFNKAVEVMLK